MEGTFSAVLGPRALLEDGNSANKDLQGVLGALVRGVKAPGSGSGWYFNQACVELIL